MSEKAEKTNGEELATITQIQHPNVLRALECGKGEYTNGQGETENKTYLITEIADGGELLDWLG